ncbi:MAG: hypothetical protein ACLP2J_15410 [Acidimicrobiales bacterium]
MLDVPTRQSSQPLPLGQVNIAPLTRLTLFFRQCVSVVCERPVWEPMSTTSLQPAVDRDICDPAEVPQEGGLLEPLPRTRTSLHLAAVATYLALALVLWGHVWIGGNPAHLITCNCGDTAQQVWWFEWLPWAVTHGHNPLLTNALWARLGGVNALSNTSWLAPATLLSPITVLFGPVASFNVANLLAPVVSGWAAFALAGRFSRRAAARLVAGGLYAFSPYVLRNTVIGHVGLTLTEYLPLVLLLGLQLLSRSGRPVRIGLWLGLLTILQFFTGLEVLAITAVTGGLCAIGVVICRPKVVTSARKRLLISASVGASLTGVVLAYPIWFYLAGPRHVVGPIWPVTATSAPWNIFVAGPNVFNAHTSLTTVGYLGPQGPNTDYLGVGLLLAVAASCPLWRRRRSCTIVAGVGVASWVLEFFPAGLWAKIPFLSSIQLIRFALPVSLCMGLLLAASIDCWWSATARWWPAARDVRRRSVARVAVVMLVGAAFVPLVETYSLPFRVTTATVPAWFEQDASRLPPGTAVLTIPFAFFIASRPMAWQAEAHDSFDLIGGWAFVPGGNGVDDEMVSALGGPVAALRALSDDPLGATIAEQQTVRAALTRWRPLVIVVIPQYAAPGAVVSMTATLGLSPTRSDGVWVWNITRTTRLGPLVDLSTIRR